ncbi:DUF2218 domain-containing protein [Psychromarinibacter sp. S121]|uniref:DUF2218 domain-containing protein n=1 Tax=Psychromarinibacter sp. S121 TaxID=3415127 RepID=UPI003C7E050F
MTTQARWETANASKYLQQLCKHFAHKVEVDYGPTEGRAALPMGPSVMTADAEALTIEVTAPDAEGLERAKGVIDSHLVRFAFREEFERMPWADEAQATA